ncbi:hypothetical protein CKA32_003896 [Geitlerinema sp. FC II]|nr:hypothetical protein CKA32_003896 [Geitlerinema sp. FC II]
MADPQSYLFSSPRRSTAATHFYVAYNGKAQTLVFRKFSITLIEFYVKSRKIHDFISVNLPNC